MYGDNKIAPVKDTRGTVHQYLAMSLDYRVPGKVKISMINHIEEMIQEFPEQIPNSIKKCPWSEDLFKVNEILKVLDDKKAKIFPTFVAKALFISNRARE